MFPKPQSNPAKQMMLNASMFRPYNPSFHNVVAAAYNMVGASNMGPFPNRRMKFGDFIDGVFMQEVPAEKQPLYAHLVVRSTSSIPILLKGKNKAKFFISGKQVWARKYVRKSKSPGEPSSLATSI
ncbi:hypothetical protein L3X38_014053 [Prunus dulcis]|uniref:Uncharacterized protein n=1 Tax=Prunus dulcis TaxID=3755 RepID=A0AAD4WP51_PRUDU|nr:hypothetical protein L3X38_014053 [Prunus dulcis]